jgi:hypothetical protein
MPPEGNPVIAPVEIVGVNDEITLGASGVNIVPSAAWCVNVHDLGAIRRA